MFASANLTGLASISFPKATTCKCGLSSLPCTDYSDTDKCAAVYFISYCSLTAPGDCAAYLHLGHRRPNMANSGLLPCIYLAFVNSIFFSLALPTVFKRNPMNDRPVFGILTQIVTDDVLKPFGKTFIPASYVKYMESAGSRVMPIRLTHTTEEYEDIFRKINGLLFIGGAVDIETSEFARVAKIFYNLALKANDKGDFFPIWGTCLGMQLLTVLVCGENLLEKTTAENIALPLNLTTEAYSSRMFRDFPEDFMKILTQEPLTGNFHHYGLTVETFQKNEMLHNFFSLLSTNTAENEAHFVSTVEGRRYPFYGVQWHPEGNRFQWNTRLNFPHSAHGAHLSSLMAEFFVNEGRKSFHHFDNPTEEASSLIYNYTPVYSANISAYDQLYFF
ncbi:gamma-glutamyl hydrolase [Cynoglossus semilaevis]|nr:gamma-glutamyl hydrolase-like [Cynoglossus semilaevis]